MLDMQLLRREGGDLVEASGMGKKILQKNNLSSGKDHPCVEKNRTLIC
jgi:hypothetical protein